MMWAFAFFSIPYPEKNIRFPHGHPTTHMCGQFWAYQVNQLLDTIRLGSPITPTGIRVVSYIHASLIMYVLLSSHTVALRNFLPTAELYGIFLRSSRSLTLLIFLSPSCHWKLWLRLGFTYHATHLTVASDAVSRENNMHNNIISSNNCTNICYKAYNKLLVLACRTAIEFIAWQKLVQLILLILLSDILYYLYKQDNKFVAT